MTAHTIDAVFENGVFRPLTEIPSEIADGERVHLVIEPAPGGVMDLAAQVYKGLSDDQVNEIEQIALDRKPLFDRTDR